MHPGEVEMGDERKSMTDIAINSAIAETQGWIYYDGWHDPGHDIELPDYCNDLNAMRDAEMSLNHHERCRYAELIFNSVSGPEWRFDAITGLCRLRAENFLVTKGLWKP